MRRVAAVAVTLVLLLAGCSPQDYVMTTVRDGTLVFIPCEEITGVQWITASVSSSDGKVWESRGEDGVFGPTAPATYGVDPEGFTTLTGPEDFDFGDETIHFSLSNTAVESRGWIIDGTKLVEGKWLDQNGRLHDKPCS
jgi:hypothetical protein